MCTNLWLFYPYKDIVSFFVEVDFAKGFFVIEESYQELRILSRILIAHLLKLIPCETYCSISKVGWFSVFNLLFIKMLILLPDEI